MANGGVALVHRQLPKYTRFIIAAMAVLWLIFPITAGAATLSELQSQLKKSEEELARYQSLQKSEQQKSQSYQSDITKLQAEINSVKSGIRSLQDQIIVQEKDIDGTTKEILQKNSELSELNRELNESIAFLYEVSNTSNAEILSDDSISRTTDSSEYIQVVQDDMLRTLASTEKIKDELEQKNSQLINRKNELAKLKGQEESKNAQLASAKQKTNSLLDESKANEQLYQQRVKKLASERDYISQEIYELRRRLSKQGKETLTLGTTAYPWALSNPNNIDPWDFWVRQCTSYAAWKWYATYGFSFREGYDGNSGHAYNWPNLARARGYTVLKSPRINSVVSWDKMPASPVYGHVAWVEGVNADGTINISEYNWESLRFTKRNNVQYWSYGTASFIVP